MTESPYPASLGPDGPMVRFSKVTKRYGPLTVLDALDLDVEANEMVSIIGPSGSGKTSVLRMLMTLEEIDEGVIYVDGQPLTHMERDGSLGGEPATPTGASTASTSAWCSSSSTCSRT